MSNKKYDFSMDDEVKFSDSLTDFGYATLRDRYLLNGETPEDMCERVANAFADDPEHAKRIKYYMSKMWFMPSTPILSNGGSTRGLPISCFLNECPDSMEGIIELWKENAWLASSGGGIGSYWGGVRSIGEKIGISGQTSGIIPFIKVMDSMTLAISQGSLRRGSSAVYNHISHPEIEEFIDIKRPTGGDANRRCLNIFNGISITDEFMEAVADGRRYNQISPKTGDILGTDDARSVWTKILTARSDLGVPYILFIDAINRSIPEHHKKLGLHVKTSNLCSEITLPTGLDHLGKERTAVCCLSSLNLEHFDEWSENEFIIEDILRFLDNVLQSFIDRASSSKMPNPIYAAYRERSVGLGVMGFCSYLQKKMIPFESAIAKSVNLKIFKHIKEKSDIASIKLAMEKGPCPDAAECGIMARFSNKTAIAPTASISIIAGESSPCIEPFVANVYVQKTLSGSFVVVNKNLEKLLKSKGKHNDDVLSSIATHEGSVAHLNFLDDQEKKVFKTSYEIDQRWVIEHAADRTPFIDQSQSLNVFFRGNVSKSYFYLTHWLAWKKGIKSLYYCRSTATSRADKITHKQDVAGIELQDTMSDDECLACQ